MIGPLFHAGYTEFTSLQDTKISNHFCMILLSLQDFRQWYLGTGDETGALMVPWEWVRRAGECIAFAWM